jgi:hypothetical protein
VSLLVALCCISVEAKGFFFSVKIEALELRLEERRKGFCGLISLGLQCSAWLMSIVEEALKAPVKEDFVKYFRKDEKALMVRGGGNKAGRFLEVVAYDEGGQKGAKWLPKGRDDWGWSRVVGELWQLLDFLESKEWPPISEELISKGKQGVFLTDRSYAEVLCSVDRDDEKSVGLKPVSVIPLDLLPSVLAEGGEEVLLAVNCYECDVRVSGLSVVPSSVAAKKKKESKGSCIFLWLKKLLGFSHSMMVLVRGYLGRLAGLDFNPNGFRPKKVSKKPIILLKPIIKSVGQSCKLTFRSSLLAQEAGCGHSALVGPHRASVEMSSLVTLTEEGLGSDSVAGSVLGLLEGGSELVVSSGPTPSTSLCAQVSSIASLEASLKHEGSSPAPILSFGGSPSGAAELGERRAVHMDEGLFANSMEVMRLDVAGGIPSPLLGATIEPVLGVPLLFFFFFFFLFASKIFLSN